MKIQKTCAECGVSIVADRRTQRFCSAKCANDWHHRESRTDWTTSTCLVCGRAFEHKRCNKGETCSFKCRTARSRGTTCTDLAVPTSSPSPVKSTEPPVTVVYSYGRFVSGPCHLCGEYFTAWVSGPDDARYCSDRCVKRNDSRRSKATRRARLRGIAHAAAAELRDRLAEYDGMCAYCGIAPHEEWDHYIPISRGGPDTIDNLFPSCRRCNGSKSAKLPIFEWMGVPA